LPIRGAGVDVDAVFACAHSDMILGISGTCPDEQLVGHPVGRDRDDAWIAHDDLFVGLRRRVAVVGGSDVALEQIANPGISPRSSVVTVSAMVWQSHRAAVVHPALVLVRPIYLIDQLHPDLAEQVAQQCT